MVNLSSFLTRHFNPITVNASTVAAGGSISQVVLRSNGVEIARLTNAPWTYNWIGVAAGQYSLTAEAIDNQGLSTQSTAVNVKVYAAAPAVPVLSLSLPVGITGFASTDLGLAQACLLQGLSVSDSIVDRTQILIDGAEQTQFIDGVAQGPLRGGGTYTPGVATRSSVCPGPLSVGTHSIKARAQSARGAVAESALLSFTVVSAQVALTQPFARGYYGPLNGSAYGPTQVQGQPVSLALQVVSGIPNPARADFYVGSGDIQYHRAPLASSGGLPLTATATGPSAGTWQLSGCVVDTAGVRTCTVNRPYVRFVPPDRAIGLTLAGPTSAGSTALTYTANFTLGSNTTPEKIGLFDADTGERLQEKLAPFTFTSPNGPNEVAFTLTLGQSRRVIASAYATDGNEFVSNSISVVSSNVAPMIAINRPETGSEFPANSSVPITVTGNDPDGTVARVELWRVGDNGNPDTMVAGADTNANAASLSYTLLTPSSYTQVHRFYATVIDNNGAKIKSAITTITSRYDITDPRYFVWTNMNAALKAGNKAAALEFLTPTAQVNYGDTFDVIMPNMSAIVASYSTIAQVSLTPDTAEYLLGRDVNGNRALFVLRFQKMENGIWKLDGL
jgi:hypothetical protein